MDEVAEAFTATIPHNGHLITIESEYLDFFKQIAKERNTKVIVADNSRISEDFLREFDYMVFPDNASLALAVAEALGIDEKTAFRGMLNAHPDPGPCGSPNSEIASSQLSLSMALLQTTRHRR